MSRHLTGTKTLLTLFTALLLLNTVLVGWSLLDGLYLVRTEAQQAAEQAAGRLAPRLVGADSALVQRALREVAPPDATGLNLLDSDGNTHAQVQLTVAPPAVTAPRWYSALLIGGTLRAAAAVPDTPLTLLVAFDTSHSASLFWQALRTPWLVLNIGLILFVAVANAWLWQKLGRMQRSVAAAVEPTPLLRELLRDERPEPSAEPYHAPQAPTAADVPLQARAAEASAVALLHIDRRGTVTYANAAAAQLFGYDIDELVGKPVERLVPPWRLEELALDEGAHEGETQRLTKRGSMVEVLWSSVPLRNGNGEPAGQVWALWDITQRKREEAVLRLIGRSTEFVSDGVVITDAAQDDIVLYANEATTQLTGYPLSELVGRNLRFLYGEAHAQAALDELRRCLQQEAPCRVVVDNRRADGSQFWNELTVAPIRDNSGRVTHHVGLLRDVSTQHLQLEELVRTESRMRTVIDGAPIAICISDASHVIRAHNPFFSRLFGRGDETLAGRHLFEVIPEETWRGLLVAEAGGSAVAGAEITLPRRGGEPITVRANVAELDNRDGGIHHVTFMLDITGRRRAEQALAEQRERALVTLESIGDGVITTNAQGAVDYLNPVAERLTGRVKEEVLGVSVNQVFQLLDEESREPLKDPVERALRLGRMITLTRGALLVSADGREFNLHITATPIRDREQSIVGAVVVFRDVSASRAVERQITFQAKFDALTGLFNRREFQERLDQALVSAREEQRHHVLGYLDLDKFKPINDSCGHSAGDEALKQVAGVIQSQLRNVDVLARLGGDEFGVLLYSCTNEAAQRLAEQIREAIANYRFVWQEHSFELGVSIGLVSLSADSGTLDDVLHAADTACYLAKEAGRGRVHMFSAGDEEREPASAGVWLERIQAGMDRDRFVLFEQPLRRLAGDGPAYHAISLRLRDERGELLAPNTFLPTADRYQMRARIDEWTVSTLLSHLGQHPGDIVFGVPLSGQSVINPAFAGFVRQQLERSGANPASVCFEIDEADVLTSLTDVHQLVETLHGLNCRVALDNFGYGRAAFAQLHQLKVEFVKIEGSVVHSLSNSPIDYVIADAISRIGHLMQVRVIATGVTEEQTLEELGKLGIDYAQGTLVALGRPLVASPEAAAGGTR